MKLAVSLTKLCLFCAQPGPVAAVFLTHWADLGSWELAQRLSKVLSSLQAGCALRYSSEQPDIDKQPQTRRTHRGVQVFGVGLGSAEQGRRFAKLLDFPADLLYAGAAPFPPSPKPKHLIGLLVLWRRLGQCGRPPSPHMHLMTFLSHADPEGACHRALNFSRGFAPDARVSPYLKLLPMLAGIGSPGTLQEVW